MAQVEINGRMYDAVTGELLRVSHTKKSVVTTRRVIDGIVAPNKPLGQGLKAHRKAAEASKVHARTKKTNRLHPVLHSRQRSSDGLLKRFARTSGEQNERHQRASRHKQSQSITRHKREVESYEIVSEETVDKTLIDKMAPPSPVIAAKLAKATDIARPTPPQQIVEEVVQISWLRRHIVPAVASFAALALISGFVIYNSLPTLTMRVASARAGFNASVPNYVPSGYSFDGPISYGPGRVVIRFDSKTDDSHYTITQRLSNWDSRSLLDNFVAEEADNYVTFEEHGLTVYLYDKSQATWVDDGIWYTLEGDAELNSEQLLKVAASL